MSKHKNLIRRSAAGLILLLAFLLCACGQDPSSSAEGQTNSAPTLPILHSSKSDDPASSAGEVTQNETEPLTEPAESTDAADPSHETDTEYTGPQFAYTRYPEREILHGDSFGVSQYTSPLDKDGDGIDDQTDIFLGAKAYVDTRPQYDATWDRGWPPEGIGVCTDVVNYGLLAAGYNMKELIDQDILNHREWYTTALQSYGEIEEPRESIDFRRVRNLWVFLEHHADKLTLDLTDLAAWQPGDIVILWNPTSKIWRMHVVVISDRRASDGVPYVIHHASKGQTLYEEDYLVSAGQPSDQFPDYKPKVVIGHYRWNGYNGE